MGGYDLGNVYGRITLDASGIASGVNSARQSLQSGFSNMGQSLQSFGDQITGVGARITALTAPFVAFSASGLSVASDFEVLMKQIESFGGVAGEELEAVRQYAMQMGADTQFSAQDAGGALLDLLKSGMELEAAMATLPDVLNLAAVGGMSLSQAAGIASGSMAMFQLDATQASQTVDALAQAANASRADVADLGLALGNVGPIANTFGLDVEETAAILAVFSNNSIEGAEAGTQLKSMLLNLSRPTEEVQQAYDALGVSLYDAQGNVRDFNTFIVDLDSALDALPVQQQNEMMQRLGGSYGILGLTALRASGGIGDMLTTMGEAPEAGALAEGFMNTFAGRVDSLRGSFETFQIEALTPFMTNIAGPFVARLTEMVNSVTAWAAENPALTTTIMQIGGALVVAGPALMALGVAISTVAPILGLLVSPIVLIAGAGLALAHVFGIDLRQAFTDVIETVLPVLDNLRVWFVEDAMPAIVDFIQTTVVPTLRRIGAVIGEVWMRVAPVLGQLYEWFVTTALPAIANIIQTVFIPIILDIGRRIGEIWAVISPVLVQLYEWFVTTALPAISNAIQTIFIPAIEFIATVFKEIYETVAPILSFLIEWFVTQAVPLIAGLINDVIIPAVGAFIDVLGAIWSVVGPVLQSLVDWFQATGWPAIQGFIENIITPVIGIFVELLKGIWTLVEPVLGLLVAFWRDAIGPAVQAGLDVVTPIINGLVAIMSGIWESARPFLEALRDGIGGIFIFIRDNIIQPVINAIMSIPNAVREAKAALDLFNGQAEIVNNARTAVTNSGATWDQVNAQSRGAISAQIGGGWAADLIGGLFAPIITNNAMTPPSRDIGGEGMAMLPYLIGKQQEDNEIFVPRSSGQFIPNFMDKLDGFMAVMDGQTQSQSPLVGQVVIHANNAEGGKAAGDAFVARLDQYMRAKG